MAIGEIEGIEEGAIFPRRDVMMRNGLHRHNVWGIVDAEIVVEGITLKVAESIVLSGGYSDDLDFGGLIIYTGEGGNENGTQVNHQNWGKRNNSLFENYKKLIPVRVIKKVPGNGDFSYKYEGLYYVRDAWSEMGKDGFMICRFMLIKNEIHHQTINHKILFRINS